ncbi:MAG TPA: hypothetical protein VGD74_01925 [Vulgatibacter sp.]
METLDRETILAALERLDAELDRRDSHAEIFLVGGAVMCLAFDARTSTKDLDGWFTEPQVVREAARQVAEDMNLPSDWLNDAAKAFVPERAAFEKWKTFSRLEVSVADEATMLAMKCAAARTAEDLGDIRFLIRRLDLRSADEVLGLVLKFYPASRLPVRTRFMIEEVFDDGA